jgi:hypothetical protein
MPDSELEVAAALLRSASGDMAKLAKRGRRCDPATLIEIARLADECKSHGIAISVDNLTDFGMSLRAAKGK